MTILYDPLSLTVFDDKHSDREERWFTIGNTPLDECQIVFHTWTDVDATRQRYGLSPHEKRRMPKERLTKKVFMNDDPLDHEIDFSKGVRGKFNCPNDEIHIPVYLEKTVLNTLSEIASRMGCFLGRTRKRCAHEGA